MSYVTQDERWTRLVTFPCVLSGSNRDPASTASLAELYLPVKNPPPTTQTLDTDDYLQTMPTWVEFIETDAKFSKARKQFGFDSTVYSIVYSLIRRGLNIAICFADADYFCDLPSADCSVNLMYLQGKV